MDGKEKMCLECMTLGKMIYRAFGECKSIREINELTGNNGWILFFLGNNRDRDIFQRDIEENFFLSRSAVSKIITSMEKNGLIVRESVDHDARLKKLSLTSKAVSMEKELEKEMSEIFERITDKLTDEEIDTFIGMIRKIQSNF